MASPIRAQHGGVKGVPQARAYRSAARNGAALDAAGPAWQRLGCAPQQRSRVLVRLALTGLVLVVVFWVPTRLAPAG